jgi:hypothetical protein
MRKKIWRVLKDLEKEKINTNEAYSQLCDLYSVVVPKGTLCEWKSHNYEVINIGMCGKCNGMSEIN